MLTDYGRGSRRMVTALAGVLAGVGALLGALASPAVAAEGALSSIRNAVYDSRADGLSYQAMLLTTGGACQTRASKHSAAVTRVTAADPTQQVRADQWQGEFLYAPTSDGLASGQQVVARTDTWDSIAGATGQDIVPGRYEFVLVCQDSAGSLLDAWRGSVTFDTPDHWVADAPPAPVSTPTTTSPSPTTTSSSQNGVHLDVTPSSGPAYQQVSLVATVTGSAPAAAECTFSDGAAVISRMPLSNGSCSFVSSAFAAGTHTFSVAVSAQGGPTLVSAPAMASYAAQPASGPSGLTGSAGSGGSGGSTGSTGSTESAGSAETTGSPEAVAVPGTVETTVPTGSLAVFTPYTPEHPLDLGTMVLSHDGRAFSANAVFEPVTISDTRAGNPGWSASLAFTELTGGADQRIDRRHLGFTEVTAVYLPDNAITSIQTSDIAPSPTRAGDSWEFARAVAGAGTGAVDIKANVVMRDVPTSTTAGRYTTTITFTVG